MRCEGYINLLVAKSQSLRQYMIPNPSYCQLQIEFHCHINTYYPINELKLFAWTYPFLKVLTCGPKKYQSVQFELCDTNQKPLTYTAAAEVSTVCSSAMSVVVFVTAVKSCYVSSNA